MEEGLLLYVSNKGPAQWFVPDCYTGGQVYDVVWQCGRHHRVSSDDRQLWWEYHHGEQFSSGFQALGSGRYADATRLVLGSSPDMFWWIWRCASYRGWDDGHGQEWQWSDPAGLWSIPVWAHAAQYGGIEKVGQLWIDYREGDGSADCWLISNKGLCQWYQNQWVECQFNGLLRRLWNTRNIPISKSLANHHTSHMPETKEWKECTRYMVQTWIQYMTITVVLGKRVLCVKLIGRFSLFESMTLELICNQCCI